PEDIRLVYVFEIRQGEKVFFYSEDGLSNTYDYTLNFYNAFQIAYINDSDIHKPVDWMRSACFYQIFVDRFFRGDADKEDSYINLRWGETPNPKSFAGGDLRGIQKKLPYLRELGINALYLTPIFQSISNHKYDIQDYFTVDAMFGTNADFAALVEAAHERNIRVVIDAVFNHVSDRCSQFQDVLKNGKNSPYFDWFIIHGDTVDQEKVNYECFSSCHYMPKWNTSNPQVQDFLIRIAVHWIKEYHIDGWRLDVSDEVSHDFWRRFRQAVKAANPECAIIGENWHNASIYLQGDQYDSIMNYAFTKACLDFFAFGALDADGFAGKLNELLMRNTDTVNNMMLNLLDSHDTHRFFTQVGENKTKLESALAVLYLFVGAPCIYYGTEIAMPGGYDPDCRRTMDWAAAQARGSTWKLIQKLTKLKKEEPALHTHRVKAYAQENVFCLERGSILLRVRGDTYTHTIERLG
ncbi:MAG: glycoside hydrolase family 13 protein, partial [Faecousia sp.]